MANVDDLALVADRKRRVADRRALLTARLAEAQAALLHCDEEDMQLDALLAQKRAAVSAEVAAEAAALQPPGGPPK